jgi:hypothetical protein
LLYAFTQNDLHSLNSISYDLLMLLCVLQAVLDFMNELDFLLPFAKAGNDGILHCVRVAYVDSANLCLQNLHVHLTKVIFNIYLLGKF